MVCNSSQALGLALDASHRFRNLFPGVWWHKGGLAVPDKGMSDEVEESFWGHFFPTDEISRLQDA